MPNQESVEFVIDAKRPSLLNWSDLWNYRELFIFFAWRDIRIKYRQTLLGFLWAILQPLMMMVIFTVFFGTTLRIQSGPMSYPVFVFSGLVLWTAFSTGLSNSANSMVTNSAIIKKIYFPRLIIPVSSVIVAFFDLIMAFILFVPLLFYYHQPVAMSALWIWPLAIIVCLMATLGPGCLIAALNVKYRDFRYVIPFTIQVLFFLTPIIYPSSMLPFKTLEYVVALSPMYAAVELFRYPLLGDGFNLSLTMLSLASGVVLFIGGISYFRKAEDYFADFA